MPTTLIIINIPSKKCNYSGRLNLLNGCARLHRERGQIQTITRTLSSDKTAGELGCLGSRLKVSQTRLIFQNSAVNFARAAIAIALRQSWFSVSPFEVLIFFLPVGDDATPLDLLLLMKKVCSLQLTHKRRERVVAFQRCTNCVSMYIGRSAAHSLTRSSLARCQG